MTIMTTDQCRITGVASGPRVLVGIDDPRRELSIGTRWGSSVDWDDAEDGSDGGYDRHGTFIPAAAMVEIVRLRLATTMALNLIASGSLIPEAERRRLAGHIRALLDAGRVDVEQGGI